MRWVVLLFVAIPLVELYLLLQLAHWIDFWPTVLLVLATGIVGGTLAKMEGLRVLRAWQHAFQTMTPPEQGVLDGVLVLVGGVLLITPGVLTDLAGLLMVFPWTRRLIAARLRTAVDRRIATRAIRVVAPSVGSSPFANATRASTPGSPGPGREIVDTTGENIDEQVRPQSEKPRADSNQATRTDSQWVDRDSNPGPTD